MYACGIGSLIGPMIGGGVYDLVGFQLTADAIGLISLFFTLLYFFVVYLPLRNTT